MTSLVPRVTLRKPPRAAGFFFARTDRAPTLWRDESFRAGRKDQMWSWKRMNRPTERTGRETEILAESSIEYDHSFLWLRHIWSCDMIRVRFLGVDHLWKWWFVSLRGIIDTIVGQIHKSFFAFIGTPKVEISWGGSTDFHTLITDW